MGTPAEARVDALPLHVATRLTAAEARELVSSGAYRPAYGLGAGEHYQRTNGAGRYHLRIAGDGAAELHRDRWDPEQHPLRHFAEVPQLWVPFAVSIGLTWWASRR